MERDRSRVFKVATEAWELEQVYRLNYRTFVEEIPQHPPNPERRLVDRFLVRSTCFVCLEGPRVIGMVAVCDERPFSLDAKLPGLDAYLPPTARPCEIRLLAVERDRRGGRVLGGLLRQLVRRCRAERYDLGLVSAAVSHEKLYRHLGFVPFGPPLGTERARFQGMYIAWNLLTGSARRLIREDEAP